MTERHVILFLIPSLGTAGAERQLCELVKHLDQTQFAAHVVTFYDPDYYDDGGFWPAVAVLDGVTLQSLHKRRGALGYVLAFARLWALSRRLDPALVHGYMRANFLAWLIGQTQGSRVVWGIRRTSQDRQTLSRLSRLLNFIDGWLSIGVDLIIFNSEAGRAHYVGQGYRARRMEVVPNGIDTERFRPDPAAGLAQRQVWDIPPDIPLIGTVARLHPVKDHHTFLVAAARVAAHLPEARFVCIGGGDESYLAKLRGRAAELGIADRVHWAGLCADMPAIYNALTVHILNSVDEGFPNAVAEAMACGVPCLATDVGDAARIVGADGLIVPPSDPEAMGAALRKILDMPAEERARMGMAARERILREYNRHTMVRRTETMFEEVLS